MILLTDMHGRHIGGKMWKYLQYTCPLKPEISQSAEHLPDHDSVWKAIDVLPSPPCSRSYHKAKRVETEAHVEAYLDVNESRREWGTITEQMQEETKAMSTASSRPRCRQENTQGSKWGREREREKKEEGKTPSSSTKRTSQRTPREILEIIIQNKRKMRPIYKHNGCLEKETTSFRKGKTTPLKKGKLPRP